VHYLKLKKKIKKNLRNIDQTNSRSAFLKTKFPTVTFGKGGGEGGGCIEITEEPIHYLTR